MADGKYRDTAIASHTPGALPLCEYAESRFSSPTTTCSTLAELTPYTQAIAAVEGGGRARRAAGAGGGAPGPAGRGAPLHPPVVWADAPRPSPPTVDGIDYPSSAFSNENVWDWVYRG